ncbi:MAG: TlyA family RNA methyltransferase [Mycoplasma sp.]
MRLDLYLVQNQYLKTRNEAVKLIKAGSILVDGEPILKPSFDIINQKIQVKEKLQYVSRAGDKLAFAVKEFNIDIRNKIVLDIGASTGGFTDVCLQGGASKVYAVDVGTSQLDETILNNKNVINIENCNVKVLDNKVVSENIDLVVSDLSFISSKYMFERIKYLNKSNDFNIISLIKPQFELQKEVVKRCKGVITDTKLHNQAISNVCKFARDEGLQIMKIIESPILGAKKQNKEFLIWCKYEK